MTDTEKVQKIMELFENSSLSSMDAELEGLKIHLEKQAINIQIKASFRNLLLL